MGTPATIQAAMPGVVLRMLQPKDAKHYFDLVDRNRGHLSRNGDTTAARYPDLESVVNSILHPENPERLRFGIWVDERFVGSINLTPDASANIAEIGYWIGSEFTGYGYVSAAVRGLVAHAFAHMHFAILCAKVAKKNFDSQRVLERTGFLKTGEDEAADTIYYGFSYCTWCKR